MRGPTYKKRERWAEKKKEIDRRFLLYASVSNTWSLPRYCNSLCRNGKIDAINPKKKKPSCCHLTCEAAYLTMYTSAVIFTRTGVIQLVLKTKKKKGIFLQKDDELKFSWRLSVEQEQPIGKISVFYFIFC